MLGITGLPKISLCGHTHIYASSARSSHDQTQKRIIKEEENMAIGESILVAIHHSAYFTHYTNMNTRSHLNIYQE